MGKRAAPPDSGPIEPINLKDALEERYLAYALSTIMHRAHIRQRAMHNGRERVSEIALFQRVFEVDRFDRPRIRGRCAFSHASRLAHRCLALKRRSSHQVCRSPQTTLSDTARAEGRRAPPRGILLHRRFRLQGTLLV